MLEAKAVNVVRGGRPVLGDLCFRVSEGDFVAVVGPNGSGKSSLLRVLSGLDAPAGGALLLEGRSVSAWRSGELARARAYLPQFPVVPPGLGVEELLWLARFPFRGRSKDSEDAEAVAQAAEALGLAALLARPLDTLSGGELRRAMVARCLAQTPRLLILDEPTNHLDLRHQYELMEALRHWGGTVVMALHGLELADRYASHILMLAEGALFAEGSAAEVLTAANLRQVFGVRATRRQDASGSDRIMIEGPLPGGAS